MDSDYGNQSITDKAKAEAGIPQGTIIEYDPTNRFADDKEREPRVGLAHELTHSFDFDRGVFDFTKVETGLQKGEIHAIIMENKIRKKTNDPQRTNYGKQKVPRRYLQKLQR